MEVTRVPQVGNPCTRGCPNVWHTNTSINVEDGLLFV